MSAAALAGAAGKDPWTLRDDLASGNPGEIEAMAMSWLRSADQANDATELARRASETTAGGATVDGAPMHDPGPAALFTATLLNG